MLLGGHCAVIVDFKPSTIRQSQQTSFNNKEHSDVVFVVKNELIELLSQKSDSFSHVSESIERVLQLQYLTARMQRIEICVHNGWL